MPSANPLAAATGPSKPISISFGASKPKSSPASAAKAPAPKKRPYAALADHSDSEEDAAPRTELVSAFDQTGAITTNGTEKSKTPLVIQAEKNRDWREESRKKRRKNLLPAEVQAARSREEEGLDADEVHVERDEISKQSGLSFVSRQQDHDVTMSEDQAPEQKPGQPAKSKRTADEEAFEALMGGEKKSNLVLPAHETGESNGYTFEEENSDEYTNEEERFKADVASRPDSATLDDYAAVPVDEFGQAYLRGQGWKEGGRVGKRDYGAPMKARVVERRPALLGIGAKEVPGDVGDELGAWGKVAKGKRKTDLTYNPVVLKNDKTGETLTEAELTAKKKEDQKRKEEMDWRERKDRNLAIDERKKSERRDRDRDRHRERLQLDDGGYGSSGRGRNRSPERSKRDRSRSNERSSHGMSRRRSPSRERHRRHGSSRRERSPYRSSKHERSRSTERRHKH